MMSSELFQQNIIYMEDQDDDIQADDIIVVHMDIRQPLSSLQKILEDKIGVNLKGYKFWLQDAQELEPHKNLVDQCVKGEGLIQINAQIQTIAQRINIVDVLKPTEAALAELAKQKKRVESTKVKAELQQDESFDKKYNDNKQTSAASTSNANNQKRPCLNWVLDTKFKKEQARLKIPDDPLKWTVPQVKHWFHWSMRQFNLTDITMSDWDINGKDLCALTHEEFQKKVPSDPGNVFWTHLQLLKECKFVSVVHKDIEESVKKEYSGVALQINTPIVQKEQKIMRKSVGPKTSIFELPGAAALDASTQNVTTGPAFGVGSGNNGQVQLWQFLLEILTDREHTDIIQWVGSKGEFRLSNPERVARLWGDKKKKPAMNYEKLSRALRYYYDGDMISKVSGKRFAYKFDCDLKLLIGYDAAELSKLVNENSFMNETIYLNQMQSDGE